MCHQNETTYYLQKNITQNPVIKPAKFVHTLREQQRLSIFTDYHTPTKCTVIYYISLKFTLNESSYMFWSLDHLQGAYTVPC
jgi:hypothetical protein